ncbi:MAG: hypothetical protein SFV18_00545 [Bryobacteraceae bacterium]|nr:hypothetical protein [Bryobacteraceae bacterium]
MAGAIAAAAGVYLAIGLAFAAIFLTRGIVKLDTRAAGVGWAFRLIVLPGVAALWPLLWSKWRRVR